MGEIIGETALYRTYDFESEIHFVKKTDPYCHDMIVFCWCSPNLWAGERKDALYVMHRTRPGLAPPLMRKP